MAKLTREAWLEKYGRTNEEMVEQERKNDTLFKIEYVDLGNGYYSWWTTKIPKLKSDVVKLNHLVKMWNEKVYKTTYKDTYIDFTIEIETISETNMLIVYRDFRNDNISIDLCEFKDNEDDNTLIDTVSEEIMKKFLLFIDFMNETDVDLLMDEIISEVAVENILDDEYDKVEKPKHYVLNIKGNEIQVIDIIDEVVKDYSPVESFKVANILKYILRAKKKNGYEDFKKARKYINMLVGENDE